MSNNIREVIGKLVCVTLPIHIWSGRRKLRKEDLIRVTSEQLPAKKAASLGSKRVYPEDDLNELQKLRKQAERACEEVGVRFLKGVIAVSEDYTPELFKTLDEIGVKFNAIRDNIAANYDVAFDTFVSEQLDWWKPVLMQAKVKKERALASIEFGVQAFKVMPTEQNGRDAGLANATLGLGDQLLNEVAKKAAEVWETSFSGKDKVSQRVKGSFVSMRKKLVSLAFLSPAADPLVQKIDEILASLPKEGPIEGSALNGLTGLLYILSSPEKMRAHGLGLLDHSPDSLSTEDFVDTSADLEDAVEEPVSTPVASVETVHQTMELPDMIPAASGWF